MSPRRLTFNAMDVLLAIGDGRITGDQARVSAALLKAVPGLQDMTIDELIDVAKQICAGPSLKAAMDQLLAVSDEHGTGEVTVDLR